MPRTNQFARKSIPKDGEMAGSISSKTKAKKKKKNQKSSQNKPKKISPSSKIAKKKLRSKKARQSKSSRYSKSQQKKAPKRPPQASRFKRITPPDRPGVINYDTDRVAEDIINKNRLKIVPRASNDGSCMYFVYYLLIYHLLYTKCIV